MINTKNVAKWKLDLSKDTIREVEQQPRLWKEVFNIIKTHKDELEQFLTPGWDVIFTGSGTSEFIGGTVFKELNLRRDRFYQEIGAPDIITHPHYYFREDRKTILVQCSRGGKSPETFGSIEHADAICRDNVKHLFIVCNPEGGLFDYAKEHPEKAYALIMPEGSFDNGVMTSSYTCMTLACYLCFNLDRLDEMEKYVDQTVELGNRVLSEYSDSIRELIDGDNFEKFAFLGSGNMKYFAMEADIKVLETSAGRPGTWHDTIPGFRHGPQAVIRSGVPILTIFFAENDDYVNKYVDDMIMDIAKKECSFCKIMTLTPKMTETIKEYSNQVIYLPAEGLPTVFYALPYSIVIHEMMIYRAWQYGLGVDYVWGKGRNRGITTIVYPIDR